MELDNSLHHYRSAIQLTIDFTPEQMGGPIWPEDAVGRHSIGLEGKNQSFKLDGSCCCWKPVGEDKLKVWHELVRVKLGDLNTRLHFESSAEV